MLCLMGKLLCTFQCWQGNTDRAVLCADGTADAARANLALLRAIPSMAVHSAALPFTLRVLQQLCPPGGLP